MQLEFVLPKMLINSLQNCVPIFFCQMISVIGRSYVVDYSAIHSPQLLPLTNRISNFASSRTLCRCSGVSKCMII